MKIKYATISEKGRRYNNEDAFRVIEHPEKNRWLGIVCDGMGGHSMGEVASETITGRRTLIRLTARKRLSKPARKPL